MNRKAVAKMKASTLAITLFISVMAGCDMEDIENIIDIENMKDMENMKDTENTKDLQDTQSTETDAKTKLELTSDSMQPSNPIAANPPESSQIQSLPYDGNYPQHEAYGTGIGAMPGRVVWSYNPDSVDWDGSG